MRKSDKFDEKKIHLDFISNPKYVSEMEKEFIKQIPYLDKRIRLSHVVQGLQKLLGLEKFNTHIKKVTKSMKHHGSSQVNGIYIFAPFVANA